MENSPTTIGVEFLTKVRLDSSPLRLHGLQVLILMTERCRPGVSHAGQAMEYDGKLVAIQIWDTGTDGSRLQSLPFSRDVA